MTLEHLTCVHYYQHERERETKFVSTYNFGSDATATDFFFTNRFNPSLEYQSNLVILVVVVLLVVLIIEKKTYESHLTGRTGSG